MPCARHTVELKLVSRPFWRRTGAALMVCGVAVGWAFMLIWLTVSLWLFQFNHVWSTLILASTILFSAYLGIVSFRLRGECHRDYIFELNEEEAVLTVINRLTRERSTQMVLLADVKFAEYYPFQDSASIILHAPYADMEVPLTPFGSGGGDVVDLLEGFGIDVVNVQSDDKIPD